MKKIHIIEQQERFPSQIMVLYVSRWKRQANGLFDYESQTTQQRFQLCSSFKVFQNQTTGKTKLVSLDQIKQGLVPSTQFAFIGSIEKINAQFKVSLPIQKNSALNTNAQLFRSLRPTTQKFKHPLKQGDIIKFGRLTYSVLQTHNGVKQQSNLLKQNKPLYQKYLQAKAIHFQQEQGKGNCKICLSEETTQQNFLVSPCKCKGSCALVHLDCLKSWILSKTKQSKEGIVTTYNFTKFNCQICKEPFPKMIALKDRQYNLICIQKPQPDQPFLLIQSILEDIQKQNSIHIITPKLDSTITIGRGNQSSLRLNDISVSRNHAEITLKDGVYFLQDKQSKFGTLIRINSEVDIKHNLVLQGGRHLYSFKQENYKYPKSHGFVRY